VIETLKLGFKYFRTTRAAERVWQDLKVQATPPHIFIKQGVSHATNDLGIEFATSPMEQGTPSEIRYTHPEAPGPDDPQLRHSEDVGAISENQMAKLRVRPSHRTISPSLINVDVFKLIH